MADTTNLKPLGDRIVARRDESETRTAGGIIIPENAKKESCAGTVLAVGPGKMTESGQLLPMSVKPGDRVLFAKYGPTEVTQNNQTFVILHESEVLAVEESAESPASN